MRLRDAAEYLGLTPYLDRTPRQLSGGQRQRVASAARSCGGPRSSFSTSRSEPLRPAPRGIQMRPSSRGSRSATRPDVDLRHPRPGRSDDPRPPDRDSQGRGSAAGRRAARRLPYPEVPLRGGLPRHAPDQPAESLRGAGRDGPFRRRVRPADPGRPAREHGRTRRSFGGGGHPAREPARGAGPGRAPLDVVVAMVELLGHEVIVHGLVGGPPAPPSGPRRAGASARVGAPLALHADVAAFQLFDADTGRRLRRLTARRAPFSS